MNEVSRTISIATITGIRRRRTTGAETSDKDRSGSSSADAPEITFQGWCRNNGASGRDRRDFRACPGAFRRVRLDNRQKKGDDLVSDSDHEPDLSSDILKRLRDSSQHRGVAESVIDWQGNYSNEVKLDRLNGRPNKKKTLDSSF